MVISSNSLDLIWKAVPHFPGTFWLALGALGLLRLVSGFLNSPKGKGMLGEHAVRRGLTFKLDPAIYHVLADVLIPDGKGGTAQIDHVVLSPHGIFVIETKNYDGWIFGREKDRDWTVSYCGGRKHRFLNPILQNQGHIQALEKLLKLPRAHFHNVVFFVGDAELKTEPIPGVIFKGHSAHMQSFQQPLLEPAAAADLAAYLRGASLSHDKTARAAHLDYARSRQR